LPLSSIVDLTHSENLHWLAVFGSSVVLSLASSLVPNYAETTLDMRSHNRVRLFNETTARLHIAYIIFLLALITSNDIDKADNTMIWLLALIVVLVFVLMGAIIVSGRTIKRIRESKHSGGTKHQCNLVNGICDTPVGWWIGCRVCFTNGLLAIAVGVLCLGLTVNPTLIKHSDSINASTQKQQNDFYQALRGTYKQIAHRTKDEFEEKALGIKDAKFKDDKLNVSYWYSHEGIINQLATTHDPSAGNTYKIDEESIIGCGFFHQNSSVAWDDTRIHPVVWPYSGVPVPKETCKYAELQIAKIRSIVCATYNGSGPKSPELTVGICAFTTGTRNVSSNNNYHDFLKAKAEEFYGSVFPVLRNKTLAPQ